MKITDLKPENNILVEQVATILREAFEDTTDTWSTLESARDEVLESFGVGHLSRVALDDKGNALGWVGGIPDYNGHVYELHPMAVKPSAQGQGIGTALVTDLEEQARARGAITVMLGTDDESNGTSLYGRDLYPDVASFIGGIRNKSRHPYEFYEKCGYVIVGLIPDANGFGKPDILMAKRVGSKK